MQKQNDNMSQFIKQQISKRYQSPQYLQLQRRLRNEIIVVVKSQQQRISNIDLHLKQQLIQKLTKIPNINDVMKQQLKSGVDIKKSLMIPKNKKELERRMPRVENIKLNASFINSEMRLFLDESIIKMLEPQFAKHYEIKFKTQLIKSTLDQDIKKRAETIAKLQILQLYENKNPLMQQRAAGPADSIEPTPEVQDAKVEVQPDMRKRKKSSISMVENWEDETEEQVREMSQRLTSTMNRLCNEAFRNKKSDEAIKIKKSLEKLNAILDGMHNNVDKLRYMLKYKAARNL